MSRPMVPTALVALALFAASPAHAYIDPGTGSVLLQALIAGLAVASAAIAAFWGRIRQFFSRRQRADRPEASDPGQDSPRS